MLQRFTRWFFGDRGDLNFQTYLRYNGGCGIVVVLGIVLHAVVGRSETELTAYALVVGMASFWTGGIIGFLFGVPVGSPRMRESERADDDSPDMSLRLGEVADWLTKIVIGVSLVEIRSIGRFVIDVGEHIGDQTSIGNDGALFSALIVALAAIGFWFLYYWSWMYWPRLHRKMASEARLQGEGQSATLNDESAPIET